MGRTKAKQIQIRFLQDKPADQDFFGTHSDLAKAVAAALASNPELRTIGLLGKWGSGKSTVLRELDRSISTSTELADIKTFTFDAWEHQGEPIRRSFLESLFGFLTENKLIEATDWQADIDLLSGRLGVTENIETPELTPPAKQILWSLILVPLGLSLFGLDTLQDGLGRTTTTAGQVALFVALVCFAVPLIFVLESLFTARSTKSTSDNEVIGLIINKKVNRVKTRTIKSPEPTAIDFSETCNRLITEVKEKNCRLLCVVDNLDRLPAQDALEMWSAIRAIFANIQVGSRKLNHPFVLVPMDHSALLASFGGNETDERAKSFIDKTFDLTFRVPPPVRSDWKAFLRSQMETVFGKSPIDDRTMYFVEKVFDSEHRTANEFPTPRVVNRFVNSVAATWLARRDDNFPLAIVSLFVANLDEIEDSVLEFTQRDDLKFFDSDFADWRDQIAALYFGVPEEKSRQVLLEGPLRQSIDDGEVDKFRTLMKYPGAFKVFDDILRAYPYDATDTNSQDFVFKSAAVLETVEGHAESVRRSWEYLLDRIIESVPAPDLKEFDAKLGPFVRSVSRRHLAKLVPVAIQWLSHHASATADEESVTSIARSYDQLKQKASGELPRIILRGEPPQVISSIYWISGNGSLEGATSVDFGFTRLVPELAKLVENEDEAMVVPEVLNFRQRFPNAFQPEKTFTFAQLRDASISTMETDGASMLTRHAAQNLGIMASLGKQSEEAVDAMIDAGHLQSRLNEAINASDAETVGVLAALAIARGKPFVADGGQVGDLERLSSMETSLDTFVSNPLNILWNAQAAGTSPAFMERALRHIVNHRSFSAHELDQIAGNTEFYFSPLNKADRRSLARKIGEDERRIDRIGEVRPSRMLLDIFSPLIGLGIPDARKQCKARVENLPAESWKSYFEGQADWLFELVEKCPSDFKLTLNSMAVNAAVALIDERTGAFNPSERARLRRLMPWLNVHAERKIIEAVLLHSDSHAKNVLGFLKAIESETTNFIANHATVEQLFTLIGGVSILTAGRTWLEGQTTALQKGFSRVGRKSRAQILDWFSRMKASTPRVRGNWIEIMEHRLRFDGK